MTKRKRNTNGKPATSKFDSENKKSKISAQPSKSESYVKAPLTIQLVAGSYDGVIHGVTATISSQTVNFADTFLFTAHTSAIRCLALSPPSAPVPNQIQKIYLASGSTDERIHLYHLSLHTPSIVTVPTIPNLTKNPIIENPHNRELGALLHHSSAITALYFANRAKLLSSAEDRQISIVRTRDWNVLCSMKSPIPKQAGRPSGDTAPTGSAPCGINDFAVHPSLKLMISVSKGENCMRLWNLVTGKKAGVLNFDKATLRQLENGRYSKFEGRKVAWSPSDASDEFCVGFERGVLVYGMDSKPRCSILPEPRTKVHQLEYIGVTKDYQLLAISTEDGRIMFYSTKLEDLATLSEDEKKSNALPSAKLVAQLGGRSIEYTKRIKDFSILSIGENITERFIIATAGSDGELRVWQVCAKELVSNAKETKQIGTLLGSYVTNNRITCMKAFIMIPCEEKADNDAIGQNNSDNDKITSDSDNSSSESD